MSSVPTGTRAPSIASILSARMLASTAPRLTIPTSARLFAPLFASRISWAMRVIAREIASPSITLALV